jgi:antitoxin component YwqK of YwqJK toxin-antitoxin module
MELSNNPFSLVPLEVKTLIVGNDVKLYSVMRLLDKDYRDYTNSHITYYRNKFATKKIDSSRSYFVLPNGVKHGKYEEWHKNGQLKVQCIYNNGMKNKLYEEWHSNGQLKVRCSYKNGKRLGDLYEEFDSNGDVKVSCSYLNGKRHGTYFYVSDDKKMSVRSSYENGQLNGLYEQWHNGNYKYRYSYKNGVRDGSYEEWNDNGKLCTDCMYNNGVILGKRKRVNI